MVAGLSLLVLPIHVAVATKLLSLEDSFHSYMREHGREYGRGTHEYHLRKGLYIKSLKEVHAHNAQKDRLWTAGINHLSDRTEAELAQLRGWRGVALSPQMSVAQTPGSMSFLRTRGRGPELPQEFMNWTSLRGAKTISNQADCGSCWAISASDVLQQHFAISNPGKTRTFSAQELVDCTPNPRECGGTGGCSGSILELGMLWVMSQGVAEAGDYPYRGKGSTCRRDAHAELQLLEGRRVDFGAESVLRPGAHAAPEGAAGLRFGMVGWERLPENEYEPLLRALVERGPVGISVAARSWANYFFGIFDSCQRDCVVDHAVVLYGYGTDKWTGKSFYSIKNSWGKMWGERGFIRLLRRPNEGEYCGVDNAPQDGNGCKDGPKSVKVCGSCGILFDTVVPHFQKLGA